MSGEYETAMTSLLPKANSQDEDLNVSLRLLFPPKSIEFRQSSFD